MSSIAYVQDGKVVQTTSQSSLASSVSGSSDMDKDTFLQLLVAQMQYQDPLEPTSNTEYISQYATFTQVEEMQNMSTTLQLQRASGYVGKEVIVSTTNANGSTTTVQGKVDYVTYENNVAYVSIDESLYKASDVQTVVDGEYLEAYTLASNLLSRLAKLSNVNSLLESECSEVDELEKIYNNMTDYQKTFVASDAVKTLNSYIDKAKEIRLAAEAKKDAEAEADKDNNDSDGAATADAI